MGRIVYRFYEGISKVQTPVARARGHRHTNSGALAADCSRRETALYTKTEEGIDNECFPGYPRDIDIVPHSMGPLQTGSRKSTRATFTNGKLRLTHRLHLPPALFGFKDETRPLRTSVLPVLDEIPDTPHARLGNIGTHPVALGSRGKGFLRRQIMSFKFGPHPPLLYLPALRKIEDPARPTPPPEQASNSI